MKLLFCLNPFKYHVFVKLIMLVLYYFLLIFRFFFLLFLISVFLIYNFDVVIISHFIIIVIQILPTDSFESVNISSSNPIV